MAETPHPRSGEPSAPPATIFKRWSGALLNNPECRLFLIDHSKPNSARWCSMAVCGNRVKARRHYDRVRQSAAGEPRN
ncbi:CGNR zinc finger domain-containing protein [Actinoplanes palleronii]|uniref:Zinc finger CGNR domain-containing protein n=1 Tax=Actinoplanes palleronii TaxID=113570 RepID=A0ABQ4BPP7_9ACTN|nr:CGNR zinc finger domain-containing protein [Actinoplanes palleronii]GIE72647.1 hypothetical protein Apa02nite_087550 [Actinoplanes palleronii]